MSPIAAPVIVATTADRAINPRSRRDRYPVRPLLKWAGGKRQLLPHLRRFYPPAFGRYIEPFFGSGAVFFDLYGAGRLAVETVLIDSNADLIGCYETVRDATGRGGRRARSLAAAHSADGATQYFAVRDTQFNPARDRLRGADGRIAYTPQLAAMLIYLNRTGFNGLFRVNARGEFNVPPGRYERPRIADRAKLLRVASAPSSARVTLALGSFERCENIAAARRLPLLRSACTRRSADLEFHGLHRRWLSRRRSARLQRTHRARAPRLPRAAQQLDRRRDHRAVRDNDKAHDAGLRALRVPARRAINSNAARRGRGRGIAHHQRRPTGTTPRMKQGLTRPLTTGQVTKSDGTVVPLHSNTEPRGRRGAAAFDSRPQAVSHSRSETRRRSVGAVHLRGAQRSWRRTTHHHRSAAECLGQPRSASSR